MLHVPDPRSRGRSKSPGARGRGVERSRSRDARYESRYEEDERYYHSEDDRSKYQSHERGESRYRNRPAYEHDTDSDSADEDLAYGEAPSHYRLSSSPDKKTPKSSSRQQESGSHPAYGRQQQYQYAQPAGYPPHPPPPTTSASSDWAPIPACEMPGFVPPTSQAGGSGSMPGAFPGSEPQSIPLPQYVSVPQTQTHMHTQAHTPTSAYPRVPSSKAYANPPQWQYAQVDAGSVKYSNKTTIPANNHPPPPPPPLAPLAPVQPVSRPYTISREPQFKTERVVPGNGRPHSLSVSIPGSNGNGNGNSHDSHHRSHSLSVGGGGAGLGARPPASPLLEPYKGTYQSISPMPSPIMDPSKLDDDLSDLELFDSRSDSDHRRRRTKGIGGDKSDDERRRLRDRSKIRDKSDDERLRLRDRSNIRDKSDDERLRLRDRSNIRDKSDDERLRLRDRSNIRDKSDDERLRLRDRSNIRDKSDDERLRLRDRSNIRDKSRTRDKSKSRESSLTRSSSTRQQHHVRHDSAGQPASMILISPASERKKVSFYDATEDALALAEALQGTRSGVDTKPLISILPHLTDEEIMTLRKEYKNHVKVQGKGVNIAKHIRLKLPSGSMGKACYATALGRWESEAFWANCYYQSGSSRRELLIESLLGRTNSEIREVKACFRDSRYGDSLERCMKTELKADKFRTAVLLALEESRQSERAPVDLDLVQQDVHELRRSLVAREGGETAMIYIIVLRSDSHLREVLRAYERTYQQNFTRAMLSKSNNLVGETLAHILNGAINRPMRDAMLLNQALHELQPGKERSELLISRLVRLHWEPGHFELVKREFRKRYNDRLENAIAEEILPTSGGSEWGEFCIELVRSVR
ncbi:hypothetical protein ASPZODRAFT_134992 [Penicilliopsis zonata CBS 506.65]|uniref:Annexin n=1 Tax=Penicilliopsis zonata CBS 506.65 TaxID=1073090 RepID=A0A1L9SAS1_9EURO|nr:hypothetical protein ASPZODRAFT_134992 [Penicilliopsis zonata CBS 506.65]OJJ44209.1 hypothetical protein ASPZODRAFT_134992 [Penicilliopsis zonata CBS 506.65]